MKQFNSSFNSNRKFYLAVKKQQEKEIFLQAISISKKTMQQNHYAKLLLTFFFLAIANILMAQNSIKEKYKYAIGGSIEMIEKAPGGFVLVGSSNGLSGIEAQSNNVKYTYTKMGKIKPEEMQLIPNTPYIVSARKLFIFSFSI